MTDNTTEAYRDLYRGLLRREMPETVARRLEQIPELAQHNKTAKLLHRVAQARPEHSSMGEGWFEPVALDTQIETALGLFAEWIERHHNAPDIVRPAERAPDQIRRFIEFLSRSIEKGPGRNSFRHDRFDREGRKAAGLELSNHAYNKRFRFLARMEEHLAVYEKELRFLSYRIAGKSGLVDKVIFEDFSANPWSAAFVAYYAARKKRRSIFTNWRQEKPYDRLADHLFRRCLEVPDGNWFAIAHIFPEPNVLERLSDEQKGKLIGHWLVLLRDLSDELRRLWARSEIDLHDMIVKRGDDSSSWNLAAQGWNAARSGWMSLLASLGQAAMLEHFCPGKVLRLMAGDVAAWHRTSGGEVHPDTRVWRDLPFPWEVMAGAAVCTQEMVAGICRRVGIDPVKAGWIEAQVSRRVEEATPTPELVHGVAVASPELATLLRRLGYFSGKDR